MPLCGWGGQPRCGVRMPRRGLCPTHAAEIRAAAERAGVHSGRAALRRKAKPAKPKPPPLPAVVDLTPADVFDMGSRKAVPTAERAAHMSRWLWAQDRPVRRSCAVRVAGVEPTGGAGFNVLQFAASRGWITRGDRGVLTRGPTQPPEAPNKTN